MIKKLVIELEFAEFQDFSDEPSYLEANVVRRHPDTTLTEEELSQLGEVVGQSDRWQVDNWIAIQRVLGGSPEEELQ